MPATAQLERALVDPADFTARALSARDTGRYHLGGGVAGDAAAEVVAAGVARRQRARGEVGRVDQRPLELRGGGHQAAFRSATVSSHARIAPSAGTSYQLMSWTTA
jgi:hypothetical protein